MPKTDTAFERVQNLYLLQGKLWSLMDSDLGDPRIRKEAREQAREFQQLLGKADWRYMGGEDVLAAMKQLPTELESKLKTSPVSARTTRRVAVKKTTSKKQK